MLKSKYLSLIPLLIAASSAFSQKADLIIVNAKVVTMEEPMMAEAVAISGNKILATGTSKDILKLKRSGTRVIDAGGKTVIPGLVDSHLHVIRGGRFYNTELRWDGVPSLNIALQMLREQAQRTPAGQWVRVVGGWNEYQFAERRLPTLAEINDATGNTPAFILYLYGKAWLNKPGLKALGINSSTPNPPGGLIERDDNGDPTGLLVAEPNALHARKTP
jgi:predicted amidohydrolase YtcJ